MDGGFFSNTKPTTTTGTTGGGGGGGGGGDTQQQSNDVNAPFADAFGGSDPFGGGSDPFAGNNNNDQSQQQSQDGRATVNNNNQNQNLQTQTGTSGTIGGFDSSGQQQNFNNNGTAATGSGGPNFDFSAQHPGSDAFGNQINLASDQNDNIQQFQNTNNNSNTGFQNGQQGPPGYNQNLMLNLQDVNQNQNSQNQSQQQQGQSNLNDPLFANNAPPADSAGAGGGGASDTTHMEKISAQTQKHLPLWTRLKMMWDPHLIFKKVDLQDTRGKAPLPDNVISFLRQKMVKLKIHRIDCQSETKPLRLVRQKTRPMVRVHLLDISNGGQWLQKPANYPLEAAVYHCKSAPKVDNGKDPDLIDLKDQKDYYFLPRDSETNPNCATLQSAVSFIRPFETPDIKGTSYEVTDTDTSDFSWDFVIALPADLLFSSNIMFMFEILEKFPANPSQTPLRLGWSYLRPDQLYDGGIHQLLEHFEASGAHSQHLSTEKGLLRVASIVSGTQKIEPTSESEQKESDQNQQGTDDNKAQNNGLDVAKVNSGENNVQTSSLTQQADDHLKLIVPSDIMLPRVNRFQGCWLQVHRYLYTNRKGHVSNEGTGPTVFEELHDLRSTKPAALLVSLELVPQPEKDVFLQAIRDSRSSGAILDVDEIMAQKKSNQSKRIGGRAGILDEELEDVKTYTKCVLRKEQKSTVPLPEEFGFQLPSDGRGCFRVSFSPFTSRFLACAVELKDETWEIRIFDLAKSQVHCVCHGHRELIYDLHWIPLPQPSNSNSGDGTTAGIGNPNQEKLDALKASIRSSTSFINNQVNAVGTAADGSDEGLSEEQLLADFPCALLSASSDGTCMIFEIPEERNWKSPLYPSQTLYHPSYCYAARSYMIETAQFREKVFYTICGGYQFGLRVWRIDRKNTNELKNATNNMNTGSVFGATSAQTTDAFGSVIMPDSADDTNNVFGNNNNKSNNDESVKGDWVISDSTLVQERAMDDGSHVTAIRFGGGFKRDLFYTSHSSGRIMMWSCGHDLHNKQELRLQQVKSYMIPDLAGTFFYNFEIITEQLQVGRAINGATLGSAEEWILLNAKDNLIRICGLQQSTIRIHMEISGCMNSKFPIRSCISPDGRVICSGCETGRLFFFSVATGKHVESWESIINVQLSSPIVDARWSATHNFLASSSFGSEEPPILVYRHVNTKADEEIGLKLLSTNTAAYTDQANDRISEWAAKWVTGHAATGGAKSALGHEKKRELKSQILARVVDGKRHTEIMKHVERHTAVMQKNDLPVNKDRFSSINV